MRNLSVIIPSKTASNLIPCLAAIRECEPNISVIVINDDIGPEWNPRPDEFQGCVVTGKKPFGFPANVNLGIQAAGEDDVIVCNDDALLQSAYGFTMLQAAAHDNPEFGIISATTNVAGNIEQFPAGKGLRTASRNIAFVCVCIPRSTIDRIGLMDERFGGLTPEGKIIYGSCDSDLCRRVRNAGLKIGVHDGCYVDHGSLKSTFRGDPNTPGDCAAGRDLYIAKWGSLD